MNQRSKNCMTGIVALVIALTIPLVSHGASVEAPADAEAPKAVVQPARPAQAPAKASLMGMAPLSLQVLALRRGAADVFSDMQLKGVVSDNRAINVSTGNNLITEGSFAGAAGLPMVVQNTGNNVLIQNATILNIQLK